MSIRYTCDCGASIRLPHTAAGRKAKCKACGNIFRVPRRPAGEDLPVPMVKPRGAARASGGRSKVEAIPAAAPGGWLDELAAQEPTVAGEPAPPLLEITDDEPPKLQGPGPAPRADFEETRAYAPDPGPWIHGPERSFWADLAESFLIFLDPGNFVAFIALIVIELFVDSIPMSGGFALSLRYLGAVILVKIAVYGYIYAFFMGVVRATAAGEDEFQLCGSPISGMTSSCPSCSSWAQSCS